MSLAVCGSRAPARVGSIGVLIARMIACVASLCNGEVFFAYVQEFLAAILTPGDIVMADNWAAISSPASKKKSNVLPV